MTEFLRMSGVYWGVTALDVMGKLDKLNKEEIIDFIKKCQCPKTGGFAPCEGHDPHILYTLSAIQVCPLTLSIYFDNYLFTHFRYFAHTIVLMKLMLKQFQNMLHHCNNLMAVFLVINGVK